MRDLAIWIKTVRHNRLHCLLGSASLALQGGVQDWHVVDMI